MKKITLILSLTVISLLLAGCDQPNTNSSVPPLNTNAPAMPSAPPATNGSTSTNQ